jgi:hypothetical protein
MILGEYSVGAYSRVRVRVNADNILKMSKISNTWYSTYQYAISLADSDLQLFAFLSAERICLRT